MVVEITKEFQKLVKDLEVDEIDDELTEDDVMMWGYDSLDDFWESNM
jgi:hypothetical protein